MKVQNKDGKGNPWHEDSTGEFTSPNNAGSSNKLYSADDEDDWDDDWDWGDEDDDESGAYGEYTKSAEEREKDNIRAEEIKKEIEERNRIWKENLFKPKKKAVNIIMPTTTKSFEEIVGSKSQLGETSRQSSSYVNPNFNENDDYRYNCSSCAISYELRRRGYDVEALPFNEKMGMGGYQLFYPKRLPQRITGKTSEEIEKKITDLFRSYGADARGFLLLKWKSGDGHICNLEFRPIGSNMISPISRREVWIRDAQSNEIHKLIDYLKYANLKEVEVLRTDDLGEEDMNNAVLEKHVKKRGA